MPTPDNTPDSVLVPQISGIIRSSAASLAETLAVIIAEHHNTLGNSEWVVRATNLSNFLEETSMFRKFNLSSAPFGLITLVFVCASVNAQTQSRPQPSPTPASPQNQSIVNTTKSNIKDRVVSEPTPTPGPQNQSIVNTSKSNVKDRVVSELETGGAKGWDGEVQGRVLVTPVTVTFDNPQDYDNFAAGRLRLNLIAKNTLSGQTIRLDSRQLSEGFRPAPDKRMLTINVIADNMSAPLSEAACGVISPSAENTAEGVNIILSYAGCGSEPAQRPGQPIGGIIVKGGKNEGTQMTAGAPIGGIVVKGGKNPGGNLNIRIGGSRITTREEAAAMSRGVGVIPGPLSKGAGEPKANGF